MFFKWWPVIVAVMTWTNEPKLSDLKPFSLSHVHIVTRFCLVCACACACVCFCLTVTDRQTFREVGVGCWDEGGEFPSTQCLQRHKDSLTLLWTYRGGWRGQRGRRSAFMLITNNALLCPQHNRESTQAARMSLNVIMQNTLSWVFLHLSFNFFFFFSSTINSYNLLCKNHTEIGKVILSVCGMNNININSSVHYIYNIPLICYSVTLNSKWVWLMIPPAAALLDYYIFICTAICTMHESCNSD